MCRWPRATVPSTTGRADRPSPKKSVAAKGLYRGWLCMSCRQPAKPKTPASNRCLRRHIHHLPRIHALQKMPRGVGIKLRIRRFYAQEKLVSRGTREFFYIKDWVIRLGQSIEHE